MGSSDCAALQLSILFIVIGHGWQKDRVNQTEITFPLQPLQRLAYQLQCDLPYQDSRTPEDTPGALAVLQGM